MKIDIRKGGVEDVDGIIFDDDGGYVTDSSASIIRVYNNSQSSDHIAVRKDDIDNLIKALNKAKELWGE